MWLKNLNSSTRSTNLHLLLRALYRHTHPKCFYFENLLAFLLTDTIHMWMKPYLVPSARWNASLLMPLLMFSLEELRESAFDRRSQIFFVISNETSPDEGLELFRHNSLRPKRDETERWAECRTACGCSDFTKGQRLCNSLFCCPPVAKKCGHWFIAAATRENYLPFF